MRAAQRTLWCWSLLALVATPSALAQTAPAADVNVTVAAPAATSAPAIVAPAEIVAPPPPRAWWVPPPRTETLPPPPPTSAPIEVRPFNVQCDDDPMAGRIAAEVLASTATIAATGFLTAFVIQSRNDLAAVSGLLFGVSAYVALPPLAVHGVARNFGGNGRVWASLLGGLLVPVLGHVVGYELSHTPECNADGPRTAHARPRRPTLLPTNDAPAWMPTAAAVGTDGVIFGASARF